MTEPKPEKKPSAKNIAAAKKTVESWFAGRGWKPFRFQRQTWNAMLDGESGLIHATTGTGKTYAAWLGPIIEWLAMQANKPAPKTSAKPKKKKSTRKMFEPLRVLWLTPLRALAADTHGALQAPLDDLQIPWLLESRTGDTSATVRSRQRTRLPTALITTPESLTLLLSQTDAEDRFAHLQTIIVDEWHELLGNKRGVQTELALARLRTWRPNLKTWGLSATLGNTDEAQRILLGTEKFPLPLGERVRVRVPSEENAPEVSPGKLIQGARKKTYVVESLIPETIDRFPWAGHLGLRLVESVASAIDAAETSLVFTNTRSQTEAWYQGLLNVRPDWAGRIALHHGSLDRGTRDWVEHGLREGELKSVVCTSTLDLGVDFTPVDRVFQVGSPKGIARLLQRAGRSGHSPGRPSKITCVPTHAFELVEVAAARDAITAGFLESRTPARKPIDVLIQHAVTMALGGGFDSPRLLDEIRSTASYADLSETEWKWVLDFISTGGETLKAYPEYHKVTRDEHERYRLEDRRLARQHRMSIGTIVSDASLTVQFLKGGRLGTIEEAFLAKIKPGEHFVFAGRLVELVSVQDSKVYVRRAKKNVPAKIPRWMGGRMPLSTELCHAVREKLHEAANGEYHGAEMTAVRPVLELQQYWSQIPERDEFLIERSHSREGHHTFFYPFAGRLVHEGLSSLFAYRISQTQPITFSISINDYGFELLSPTPFRLDEPLLRTLVNPHELWEDLTECMNAAEMSRRQFREIAHISGLVFRGYPNQRKSARQLQASTGLLFDVFREYDPDNLLLKQAEREVLEQQLEHSRMKDTLQTLATSRIVVRQVRKFSPLGFPLLVDRLRARLSSEKLADRVKRMQSQLESAADQNAYPDRGS